MKDVLEYIQETSAPVSGHWDLSDTNIGKYKHNNPIICEIVKREMYQHTEAQRDGSEYYVGYLDKKSFARDFSVSDFHVKETMDAIQGDYGEDINLGCFILRRDDDGDYGVVTDGCHYFNRCREDCLIESMQVCCECLLEDYTLYDIYYYIVFIKVPSDFCYDKDYMSEIKKMEVLKNDSVSNTKDININKNNKGDGAMDIFGLKVGAVENGYGVQMDKDGNLGINGRYLDEGDILAELGSIVDDECIKLIIIPTDLESIKPGDIFLDGDQALIVRTVDNATGSIDYYKGENAMRKVVQKHPMLRKVMISKLVNLYSMFKNVSALLPLMIYGEDKVISLITQQVISGKKIDLVEIEYQLNPVKAQTDLTKSLTSFVEAVKGLK